jgi:hypothetical protein
MGLPILVPARPMARHKEKRKCYETIGMEDSRYAPESEAHSKIPAGFLSQEQKKIRDCFSTVPAG